MNKLTYLSGPIDNCSNEEKNDWRTYVKSQGIEYIDPMDTVRKYNLTIDDVEFIVQQDKKDIDSCGLILVNPWKISAGTMMEIMYAYMMDKYIITVHSDIKSLSPWIKYHSNKIFKTVPEAVNYIKII